jgi:voltage-gated potassium channel
MERVASLSGRRVRDGVRVLVAVITAATCWYWLAEGFGFLEALFQTVITVSTVGFGEVEPLDTSGRIATMFVIIGGVGAAMLTLSGFVEETVADQLNRVGRRRMERRIERLRDHAVVCGYGRVGTEVAELLATTGDVLVLDADAARAAAADAAGYAAIHGDSTDDVVLASAGLERARVLVTTLPTDADNLYVVLSGRSASQRLRIVARGQSARSEAKLVRAGADRVVVPEDIGARRMAAFATRPTVSDFLDVMMSNGDIEYRLEEVRVAPRSRLVGATIRDTQIRDRTGALLLGVWTDGGSFVTNPPPEQVLTAGSVLIAIGTPEQLGGLEAMAADTD